MMPDEAFNLDAARPIEPRVALLVAIDRQNAVCSIKDEWIWASPTESSVH